VIEDVIFIFCNLLLNFLENSFPKLIDVSLAVKIVQHEWPIVDLSLFALEALEPL